MIPFGVRCWLLRRLNAFKKAFMMVLFNLNLNERANERWKLQPAFFGSDLGEIYCKSGTSDNRVYEINRRSITKLYIKVRQMSLLEIV